MTVLGPPLDAISKEATPFPVHHLPKGGTALSLFAAAFLGVNDAIHFARNDMTVTCNDIDGDKIEEMRLLYPADWRFTKLDAWNFATVARQLGDRWDVVSVDTWTGPDADRSLQSLDLWCSIADLAVTVTLPRNRMNETFEVEGFDAYVFPRSVLAAWLVLTRQ